jgi:NAD-dependent dihydropyrimidine dehydrogenase PreA subunit
MIEHIFEDLCTGCNTCIAACPTHVLDLGKATSRPLIARQDQCQTCYMCELYCDRDAIYVGADQRRSEPIDPEVIRKSGFLGQLRRDYEWDAGVDEAPPLREYWQSGLLLMEGAETSATRYVAKHPELASPPRGGSS